MSKLAWMDFAEYPDTEFTINYISTSDKAGGISIKHEPSGKSSRFVSNNDVAPGERIKPILLKELIAELRAAGIEPQPRKVGIKKIGKPRWSEAQRQPD